MKLRILLLDPDRERPSTGWTIPVQWGVVPLTLHGRLQFQDEHGDWHDVEVEELHAPPTQIR